MLTAGAYAALGGDGARAGALLKPEEHFLELHHAGIGEQQRRIIGRHQGRACHHFVPATLEIVQESPANVVCFDVLHPVNQSLF